MAALAALYGASAALQLAGGYFAAENIRQTARLNQDVAEMNAEFAELDRYDALLEGKTQQARYQSIVDQTLADQKAVLAAADVDTSFGTAAAITEETNFIAELNKMEIQKNAEEQALGYSREARQFRLDSFFAALRGELNASNVEFNAIVGATSSAAQGFSSAQSSRPSVSGYRRRT